ncbi:MAG: glucose-6-phosphate dehydrogenase assembly protein OpcA [Corynebacterium sp.]|uniref:glucose-6-phosphate dehydrogenase assembly protein OpcA n=1 Tax=Corynebacterium TaxID=1716 RepID=UPI002649AF87|nr:glucose-6-phosphate dehydrogenase assembly protein OpcA [Corynebacterium sp.]MDN5722298.1 glucose-6-phosphate dehydrogenase assembly protein OpcA [Corynebacterium sp.]MDN6283132.1 glucose-6-phosphate dehydrogenase assembly protein OpcA [Corynebacterium sp.]MDN6306814.1 glucose-6-phosphate dehydrogenase assembly protein OpcA [Corynebacterium sp.]MDN6352574.1 glucose-6-phosphate dehydrogenase assembly protein OpcA [Corynebacterium sp.]MDN6366645.1 glucose-6-phosphate dehydrogenase assembly pr
MSAATFTDTSTGDQAVVRNLGTTTTRALGRELHRLREQRGEVATGRVLTLIVSMRSEEDLDAVVAATVEASREHPARVIFVVHDRSTTEVSMDAAIHLGGDAGASEMILMRLHGALADHADNAVMPLLLPDTPVVVWWPFTSPRNPAADALGALATRRITDSLADATAGRGAEAIFRRRIGYSRGDSDLVWSRITPWRGLLSSALDQRPGATIVSAEVDGPADDPAVDIAAGWLAHRLNVPVSRCADGSPTIPVDDDGQPTAPVRRTVITLDDGEVVLEILDHHSARVSTGIGTDTVVNLSRRPVGDCLAEELRYLEPDRAFGDALHGLPRVRTPKDSMSSPLPMSSQESRR